MEFIDIGVNLTNKSFRKDLDDVLARAADAGVHRMVVTGTSARESAQALELAEQHRERMRATAGLHPHGARHMDAELLRELDTLAANPLVVAVGETGLDFNRDFSPRPQQERAFEQQLELAAQQGKPVFLHQRDAHERFRAIMKHYRDHLTGGVVHCFTDTRAALHDYLDMDLHIGITGWICDDRRGGELRELVRDIPADRLMVETDAPFLLPRDLKPKPGRGRNEPAFLPHVAQRIAVERDEPIERFARNSTATAEAFFSLTGRPGS